MGAIGGGFRVDEGVLMLKEPDFFKGKGRGSF